MGKNYDPDQYVYLSHIWKGDSWTPGDPESQCGCGQEDVDEGFIDLNSFDLSTLAMPTEAPSNCRDSTRDCEYWGKSGECDKNPGFMLQACKKACNACPAGCEDDNGNC